MHNLTWTTQKRKVKDLIPWEHNPRGMDIEATRQLEISLQRFGLAEIPAINLDNVIIAGHQRVAELMRSGHQNDEIDVRVPSRQLTTAEFKEYNLRSNKNTGEWDWAKLGDAFDETMLIDVGFESKEIDKIFKGDLNDDFDLDAEIEAIAEPTAKPGDLYLLGRHRLLCGDATKDADIEKLMDGAQADMIFTDPPYNIDYTGKTSDALKIQNDSKSDADFRTFLIGAFAAMYKALRPGAAAYICHADTERVNFTETFEATGFYLSAIVIWAKNNATFGRQDYFWKHEPILYGWKPGAAHKFYGNAGVATVWQHPPTDEELLAEAKRQLTRDENGAGTVWKVDRPARSKEHPTMKPPKLIAIAIRNSSKRGDVILDTFGGSGSTLVAAEELNRTAYLMELDPRYVDVIIKRWEALTKGKATKA